MSPPSRTAPSSAKSDVGGGLTGSSSSYAIFFHEAQAKLRRTYPNLAFGELSKLISAQWCSLSEVEKKKYRQKSTQARRDRLRGIAFSKLNELVSVKSQQKANVAPDPTVSIQQNCTPHSVSQQPNTNNNQQHYYYYNENCCHVVYHNHQIPYHQNQ